MHPSLYAELCGCLGWSWKAPAVQTNQTNGHPEIELITELRGASFFKRTHMSQHLTIASSKHAHPLVFTLAQPQGWGCDGCGYASCFRHSTCCEILPTSCRRPGKPKEPSYRCTQCNFDLCHQCMLKSEVCRLLLFSSSISDRNVRHYSLTRFGCTHIEKRQQEVQARKAQPPSLVLYASV